MSTSLVKRDTVIAASSFGEAIEMSKQISHSTLLPDGLRGKPADIMVTLLAGQELGLGPMTALRSIHVIKGKPVMAADLMVALVLGSGACEYFRQLSSDATKAIYVTKRKGGEGQRSVFTIEDAKTAGLLGKPGSNWTKHPAAMLRARAKSVLARDAYPDILHGVYSHDEMDETETVEYSAPVIEMRPAPAEKLTQAHRTDSEPEVLEDELDEMSTEFAAVSALLLSGDISTETIKRVNAFPGGDEKNHLKTLYAEAKKDSEA